MIFGRGGSHIIHIILKIMKGYKKIGNKCYEILRGCSLPITNLKQYLDYNSKKNLTFILKDDGRFKKYYDQHGICVWKIKESA